MVDIMKSALIFFTKSFSPLVLLAMIFFGNSGCVPVTPSQSQYIQTRSPMGPARLPEYTAGTTFIYSNGTWDRVVEANPAFVIWENNLGERSLGSTDFTYRPAKWESKGVKGYRTFTPTEYLYSETNASLWPLAVGNQTRYDEMNKWGVPGIYEKHSDASWKCTVDGSEQVNVPAGVFDTWKITCSRYGKMLNASKLNFWEQKKFNYAPATGHWVVLDQDFNETNPRFRKELVAVLPSLTHFGIDKKSSIGIKEHFQQTLGTTPSGQTEKWMDAAKKISFSMKPIATYRLTDGTPCRQYVQKLDLSWQSKTYYGIACRSETGLWTVPRR